MKKRIFIINLILITIFSCTKENMRISNYSSKELLMGKWYFDNPSIWVRQFTPTQMITNPGGSIKKIVGINDSIIYFEKLGYYPPYTEQPYTINEDTLRMGGTGYFLRFKN